MRHPHYADGRIQNGALPTADEESELVRQYCTECLDALREETPNPYMRNLFERLYRRLSSDDPVTP